MTGLTLHTACLCLMSGAALGLLFLFCKLLRSLLDAGRLLTAAIDVLFCLVWAVAAFLCALVVDKGRLRLFQAVLQALGAWGTVVALDPFVTGAAALTRRLGGLLAKGLMRPFRLLRKRLWALRASLLTELRHRRRARKKGGKPPAGRAGGPKSSPRYRKSAAKSKRYGQNSKKSKNPLEKLT